MRVFFPTSAVIAVIATVIVFSSSSSPSNQVAALLPTTAHDRRRTAKVGVPSSSISTGTGTALSSTTNSYHINNRYNIIKEPYNINDHNPFSNYSPMPVEIKRPPTASVAAAAGVEIEAETEAEPLVSIEEELSSLEMEIPRQVGTGAEVLDDLPHVSPKGIYQIRSEQQYRNFLAANQDKLVVIKFFATYCRACKLLEPKYISVKEDKQLKNLPIVWAEYPSGRDNKDLFQRQLRVLTLPTIQFYDGPRGLVENFPCGPAKIPVLKRKLAQFLNSRVDPKTRQLKPLEGELVVNSIQPRVSRQILDNELITVEHLRYLRNLSFFSTLSDAEFDTMISKAKLLTFDAGDTIIRQGMPGTSFYVLKKGIAEMGVRSKFDDPISTPSAYIGAVVNELKKGDYFGERALTTGEPYRASVRVLEKVRCFAFDAEIIPESSILSRKRRASREMIEKLTERYELPKDYTPEYPVTSRDECILELLVRFKQIRQAAKCFEYVMNSEPDWGNQGEIARRAMLIRKLSAAQREEFQQVFSLVDVQKQGKISLLEMRKFMESARTQKTKEELLEMIARANPLFLNDVTAETTISRDEFMGVMAEAEFYNLFTETFQELDPGSTGYVRAGDLDEVLGGVRDLISDEKTSIIDVEDKDMLVDYEQFSKMLLGAAL